MTIRDRGILGLGVLVTVLLVIMKLLGLLSISWLFVIAPFLIAVVIVVVILLFNGVVGGSNRTL